MRKLAILLPFAAILATTGAALAVDVDAGQVSGMNPATGALSLTDGRSFHISNPVLLNGLIPGEHVIVTINDDHTVGLAVDNNYLEGDQSY